MGGFSHHVQRRPTGIGVNRATKFDPAGAATPLNPGLNDKEKP
jgi:hypothetical protein